MYKRVNRIGGVAHFEIDAHWLFEINQHFECETEVGVCEQSNASKTKTKLKT